MTITGKEFIDLFAPLTIHKVRPAMFLWRNEAVWDGELLQVSVLAYGCMVDPDTAYETFKGLDIAMILRVRLADR